MRDLLRAPFEPLMPSRRLSRPPVQPEADPERTAYPACGSDRDRREQLIFDVADEPPALRAYPLTGDFCRGDWRKPGSRSEGFIVAWCEIGHWRRAR